MDRELELDKEDIDLVEYENWDQVWHGWDWKLNEDCNGLRIRNRD